MRKLSFIQELIGSKLLKMKAKKLVRSLQANNFEHAKTVGIVYEAIDQNQHRKVVNFADYIMKNYNVQVQMVGFASNPELKTAFSGLFGSKIIVKQDFSWYGIAENSIITDFINTNFDILIDLTIDEMYPTQYIMMLSQSSFKVGRFIENQMYYDLMLDIKKENNLENLIAQIHVYLSMIKVKD